MSRNHSARTQHNLSGRDVQYSMSFNEHFVVQKTESDMERECKIQATILGVLMSVSRSLNKKKEKKLGDTSWQEQQGIFTPESCWELPRFARNFLTYCERKAHQGGYCAIQPLDGGGSLYLTCYLESWPFPWRSPKCWVKKTHRKDKDKSSRLSETITDRVGWRKWDMGKCHICRLGLSSEGSPVAVGCLWQWHSVEVSF